MIYRTKQSETNRKGYLKSTHNQVRENKETTKFIKVKTTDYDSLLDEMKDKKGYEYICAGLNSYEREVLVIDTDDETFGKKTMELLKKDTLLPHCQKVKPNGHSQTYFFIDRYVFGRGYFMNHKFIENDYEELHNRWKRLTKMMNYLYNGDICYTGYNCQNPYYENADVTFYKDSSSRYSFDELYDKCMNHFIDYCGDLDEFLKYLRKKALGTKVRKSEANMSNIITDVTLSREEKIKVSERIIDREIRKLEDSINKRIFVVCCQIAKSFKTRNMLKRSKLNEICRTAYKNFLHQDNAVGYTAQELWNRIYNDINQIIHNDEMGRMEWNKVGYTKEQRERSLRTRLDNKENRKNIIRGYMSNIITDVTLSERKIAKMLKAEWNIHHQNDTISERTIIRYIKEIKNEMKNGGNMSNIITDVTHLNELAESALKNDEKVEVKVKKIKKVKEIKSEQDIPCIITDVTPKKYDWLRKYVERKEERQEWIVPSIKVKDETPSYSDWMVSFSRG